MEAILSSQWPSFRFGLMLKYLVSAYYVPGLNSKVELGIQ